MKKQMNYPYMSKRYNILPTIASYFMSSAGKIEGVRKFKIKFFE